MATAVDARLVMFEVVLSDVNEHRRRVEQRRSDLEGLTTPTWEQAVGQTYERWDVARDGHRWVVNGGDTEAALATIQRVLGQ